MHHKAKAIISRRSGNCVMADDTPATSFRTELFGKVADLVRSAPKLRRTLAADYVLEPADAIVVEEAEFDLPEGMLRLGMSNPEFRPPFEWSAEVTLLTEDAASLKHYLITEDNVLRANRRELTPVDSTEADEIRQLLSRATN